MKNKKSYPPIVQIAIVTLITTFAWIGFEVYRALTEKPEPIVSDAVINPLNPNVDQELLNGLRDKVNLEEESIGDTLLINPETNQFTQSTEEQNLEQQSTEQQPIEETEATESGQI